MKDVDQEFHDKLMVMCAEKMAEPNNYFELATAAATVISACMNAASSAIAMAALNEGTVLDVVRGASLQLREESCTKFTRAQALRAMEMKKENRA